jgi:hypothetical protein
LSAFLTDRGGGVEGRFKKRSVSSWKSRRRIKSDSTNK